MTKKPMNIIHFTHSFIPVYGGTTTRLMNLLMNDGNYHTMIVPGKGSQYVPRTIDRLSSHDAYGNVRVQRVTLGNPQKISSRLAPALHHVKEGYKESSRLMSAMSGACDYDLVHGHNPLEFALAAWRVSSARKLPLVYEVHGLIKDTMSISTNPIKRLFDRINKSVMEILERHIIHHASKVVVQTTSTRERLVNEYGVPASKIGVLHNGVDTEFFFPGKCMEQATRLRDELLSDHKTIFSYFGFLDENNGIKFFMEVLENLPVEITDRIMVLIMGRGPYSEFVRDISSRHPFIRYLGLVEYEDMPAYYDLTDVIVIPRPRNAATETFVPIKLLEAMSMEKIVLVSDVKGMAEVVHDGVNGLSYKASDTIGLGEHIVNITKRPKEFEHLGIRARRTVLHDYTWEKCRTLLRVLYEEALLEYESEK